jgi:Flp pilus assembly protein TadD
LRYKVVENARQFDYLLRRGAAAHEANDYQEAIVSFQAALSIKPNDT